MKKAISLLLTAIMVFSLLPMLTPRDAFAAVELVVTGGSYYYDGHPHTVTAEVKGDTGYTIQYSTNGSAWTKDEPQLTEPGELTVKVRAIKGASDPTFEKTVTLKVVSPAPAGSTIKIIANGSITKAPVYKSADTSSNKLGEINAGEECTLVSQSGKWFEVTHGTLTGWVFYEFVKFVSTPDGGGGSGTPDLSKVKIVASGGTFLYDGKVHKVEAGLENGDGFHLEFSVDNGETWTTEAPGLVEPGTMPVTIRAISSVGYKETTVTIKVIPALPSGTKVKIIKHGSTTTAPIRKTPSTSGTKVGSVAAGKEVTYLSKSGDWIQIAYGGVEGYVYYWFVDLEHVEFKPTITSQPESISVIKDKTATFKVVAEGEKPITYQWQWYVSGAWTNVPDGGTSPSYSFKAEATLDGRKLRCIVTDSNGKVTSDEATLTVITAKPTITKEPTDINAVSGKTVTFSVVATGAQSYQWYYQKPDSTDWFNASGTGSKSANYSVSVKTAVDGYKYYCKVSNELGSEDSATVTLTLVPSKPKITKQPTKLTVTEGGTVVFSVTAKGKALSYQWYEKKSGGSWKKCTDASAKTATFTETAEYSHNGYSYRCVIKNAKGKVTSKTVTLKVKGAKPVITVQPTDVSIAEGSTATFSVTATGTGTLKYQWQYKKSSKASWKNCSAASAKTASYSLTAALRHDGYAYRCKITNHGVSIYTSVVNLTVY